MFSTSIRYVARSTSAITSGCIAALTTTVPACCAAQQRLSSTKSTAALEERSRKLKDQEDKVKLTGENVLASQTRATRSRKKAKAVTLSESGSYPDVRLPSVPSTEHIPASHFNLASIFSQHRPVSITTPLPTATSEEAFNSIFEVPIETNYSPYDVIGTLGTIVERIDQATHARQNGDLGWNAFHESASGDVTHLDGSQKQSFLSQFPPYTPPPPPSAFDQVLQAQKAQKREMRKRQSKNSPPHKVWSTTVFVTEYTNQDGTKSWSAETTPIVRELDAAPDPGETAQPSKLQISQPFLQRIRTRHMETLKRYKGGRMLAISVKRQRKLKMKKHKYKKLMKRTRNLRRKLDRN